MAIKVGGTTVITDGRKVESQVVNPGRFTTAERDLLTPEIGDIIFNTDEETPEVWDGTEWGPLGGGSGDGYKDVDPALSNFDVNFLGSGTQAVPWVVTPSLCNIGGILYSEPLTIFGLPPFSRISFEDPNTSVHGNRYQQPPVTTNSAGYVRFQLQFFDDPASAPNTDYSTVLKAGDAYFKWDVNINDLGIESPNIESILSVPGTDAYQPASEPGFAPFVTSVGLLLQTTTTTASNGTLSEVSPVAAPSGEGVFPPNGTGLQVNLTVSSGNVTASIIAGQAGQDFAHDEIIYFDLSSLGGEAQYPMQIKLNPISVKNAVLTTSPFAGTNAGSHTKTILEVSKFVEMTEAKTYEFTGTDKTSMSVDLSEVPIGAYTDFYVRAKYVGSTTDDNTGNPIESPWGPISRGTNGLVYSYAWSINNLSQHTSAGRNYELTEDYQIAAEPYTYILFGRGGPGGGPDRSWNESSSPGTPSQFIQMVQVRQPVTIKVIAVNGSGAIIEYEQIESGRGYNTQYKITDPDQGGTLIETSGSGAGFSWDFTQDANGFTIVSIAGGTGFAVNDTVRFYPQPAVCRAGQTNLGYDMVVVDLVDQPLPADGFDPFVEQGGYTFSNPIDSREDVINDYLIQGYGGSGGRDVDEGGQAGPTRADYTSGDAPPTIGAAGGTSRNELPLDYRFGGGGCGRTSGGGGGFGTGGSSECNKSTGGGANWVADDIKSVITERPIDNHYFFYSGLDHPEKFLEIGTQRLYAIRVA